MRMMVFFDLPMVTRAEKRAYTVFRRFLLNDGYDMIQFSVYGRILNGSDAEQKHLKRLTANRPPAGSVRVLTVTENFSGKKGQRIANDAVLKPFFPKENPRQAKPGAGFWAV